MNSLTSNELPVRLATIRSLHGQGIIPKCALDGDAIYIEEYSSMSDAILILQIYDKSNVIAVVNIGRFVCINKRDMNDA